MYSRKILIGGIFIILFGGGYYYYGIQKKPTETNFGRVITVSTGVLSESIKATGNISAIEESTLSFGREGIVAKIYKNEGDLVKKGDIIAEITAGTAELDMESAERSVNDAQATYNELFTPADNSDIHRAKATLEESESTLRLMEGEYESLLTAQKNTLADTLENIEILKQKAALAESEYLYTQGSLKITNKLSNLERDIESAWILTEDISRLFPDIIEDIEDITGMNNKTSEFYGDLGSKDMALKSRTDLLYSDIIRDLGKYQAKIVDTRNSGRQNNYDSVYSGLQDTKELITRMNNLANLVLQEFTNTPSGRSWTSDKIESSTNTIETIINSLSLKQSSANNILITLKDYGSDELEELADKNALLSKEQSMITSKNALKKAERDLQTLKKDQELKRIAAQNNLQKQNNSIQQNRFDYQNLVNGPDSIEKRNAESKLASAKISLKRAIEGMKDYQIIASFDGSVEDIPWTTGEIAETGEGILIANKNAYKISLSLDQIDIVKLQEGMGTTVTLDAYANKEFTGSVLSISATPTITSGVVSYTAIVGVSINDIDIMSNMSATVKINVSDKSDIILIPTSAILSKDGKNFVRIVGSEGVNGVANNEEKEVILGNSSAGKTEIKSGLKVGDKIRIIPVNTQGGVTNSGTSTGNSRSSNQMMRGSMGGSAGGPPPGF